MRGWGHCLRATALVAMCAVLAGCGDKHVRSDVEHLDVGGALDALGNLDLSDAKAAIEEIQRLAGG
jgi:hypothetical protein